ncbi:MAG: hypothetical protein ACOYLB_09855 [Phototrophicaceae bacterium]
MTLPPCERIVHDEFVELCYYNLEEATLNALAEQLLRLRSEYEAGQHTSPLRILINNLPANGDPDIHVMSHLLQHYWTHISTSKPMRIAILFLNPMPGRLVNQLMQVIPSSHITIRWFQHHYIEEAVDWLLS